MFVPAMFFLRMLGQYLGLVIWALFGGAMAWFLIAIRRAPPDTGSSEEPQAEGR